MRSASSPSRTVAKLGVAASGGRRSSRTASFTICPTVIELRCRSSSGWVAASIVSGGSSARSAASRRRTSRVGASAWLGTSAGVAVDAVVVGAGSGATAGGGPPGDGLAVVPTRPVSRSGAVSQGLARNVIDPSRGIGRMTRSSNRAAARTSTPSAKAAATTESSGAREGLSVSTASAGTSGAMSPSSRVSTRPGPTSTTRSAPWAAVAAARSKRTGWVIWSRSRSRGSTSRSSSSPVTEEMTRRCGGAKSTVARWSVMASAAGATSGEWKAWDTARRVASIPAARAASHTRSTAGAGPEMTVCRGPL